tara:strand:- start:511 stop:1245 length:735 start_codon:yes stop_codon:yes gene_type:complete
MNNNSCEKLIKLHKVDKRLLDINISRGDLPNKISLLKNKNDNLINDNKNYQDRLSEVDSKKKSLNSNISDIKNKINTLNEQMYQVKSNREYEALLSEIDHLNNENTNILNDLEEFDSEVNNINSSVDENNENIELLNKELSKKENQLNEANSQIEKEEKELEKNRESFIKDLSSDKSLMSLYDDKKEENDGLAFAEVNRGCCENCYSNLPPQSIIDARNRNDLVLCPSCSILLYIDEDNLVNEE